VDTDVLFELLERGVIRVAFEVDEHLPELRALMRRYRDRPMSLADACLVRMSEVFKDGVIFTLDDDFHIYRRHGSKTIPVLMPDE
jgi:predicted nucleic acid-binding protein